MKLLVILLIYVFIPAYDFSLLVETNNGKVQGTTYTLPNGRMVDAFLGIPFAEPPIGVNRFEPPQAKKYWNGIWNATYSRSACVQFIFIEEMTWEKGEEDCLYLNIFRPIESKQKQNQLLNVMVYIHGGAFMFGSGSKIYPDYILQTDDIVFVGISYRVGTLGFFSANDIIAPGNYGLKDQVAALKWVQKNIRYFGGDPGKVTIYGISAGAASVHYHLLSPLSEGLFHNAISASGSALPIWALPPYVLKNSIELVSKLKCPIDNVRLMMKCLKRKSIEEIFETTKHLLPNKLKKFITVSFGPVIEPKSRLAFLSKNPLNLLKSRKVKQVPWMVSVVQREGSVAGIGIVSDEKVLKQVNDNWNDIAPNLFSYDYLRSKPEQEYISTTVRKFYFKDLPISSQTDTVLLQALGDRYFYNDMTEAAKLHASAVYENSTYCYKFSYRGKESMCDYFSNNRKYYGVCHGDDQLYIVNFTGVRIKKWKLDNDMSNFLTSTIIAFMKSGNPNTGTVKWRPIAKGRGMDCLNIYSPRIRRMEDIENKKTSQLWNDLLPSEHRENPE